MTRAEVREVLDQLRVQQRMKERAEKACDALKDRLKAHMMVKGLDSLEVDGYTLDYKTVCSTKLDVKALKAAAPEIYSRYSTRCEIKRFMVGFPL